MNLFRQIGTNVTPAPADGVAAAADRLFDAAAAGSLCTTPLIALNELLGQRSPPPWSPETSLYRANVLSLLDELKKRGARPILLLTNSQPNFWASASVMRCIIGRSSRSSVAMRAISLIVSRRRSCSASMGVECSTRGATMRS